MSNEKEIAAIEKTLERAGLLGEYYNKSVARVLVEAGYRKADASFERYLLDKLLHGAEDYCAYCANAPADEACLTENEEDCRAGIRAFYERFVEGK